MAQVAAFNGEVQMVVFRLADEEYAVPITQVQEINRMTEVTRVPRTPEYVEGIINLRGRVIPVIDLKKRFGLASRERGAETRIVVVEVRGETVGMVVDAVTEVLHLDGSDIEPPPPAATSVDAAYIQGVGKVEDRLLILLDLDEVFVRKEMAS